MTRVAHVQHKQYQAGMAYSSATTRQDATDGGKRTQDLATSNEIEGRRQSGVNSVEPQSWSSGWGSQSITPT